MLATVFLCALVALTSATPITEHFYSEKYTPIVSPANDDDLMVHTYTTRLDHFRPQDNRMVEFTYHMNHEFYRPGGPIFVFINNGRGYTTEWIRQGLMYDIARDLGGILATATHRYFRDNRPTENSEFDNLEFLTVDQALADIAVLIADIREELGTPTANTIVWGTGYGATLAVMARKKFPHLVDGVWASSGFFRAEVIDTGFYDNLSQIIRYAGSVECADRVDNAFDVLEYLIDNAEVDYLVERLRLCGPLDVENDQEVGFLLYRFIDLIAGYFHIHNLNGVRNFCSDMNIYDTDTLNSLIRWIEYVYGPYSECVTVNYADAISRVQNTTWDLEFSSYNQLRLWTYLQCTQMGSLRTTSEFSLGIFTQDRLTESYQFQYCADVLGEQYNPDALQDAVDTLNFMYGGQDQVISHVVFSNAGLDPFIHHGIAEYDNIESEVVYLTYASAGADLRSISTADSVDLYNGKRTIERMIHRWAYIGGPRTTEEETN